MKENKTQLPYNISDEEDGLEFSDVFNFLWRNKKLITISTVLFATGSTLYAYSIDPKWEGSFQIVISSTKKQRSSDAGSLSPGTIQSLMGGLGGGFGMELGTEVVVLESPSVLMPVFNYVKKQKYGDEPTTYSYKSWFGENVRVRRLPKTKVLDVSYRDTDKSFIIPVLNKIKDVYKEYSIRERKQSLDKAVDYAKRLSAEYKEKAEKSNRELDNYEMRYGIRSNGKWAASTNSGNLAKIVSSSLRGRSGLISTAGALQSAVTGGNKAGDPIADLASINRELIRRRSIFNENDPTIKALERERDSVREYIEISAGGSISSPSEQPRSREHAQEIMVRYKQIARSAQRTYRTQTSLEDMLIELQLEQARADKPWELISTPTLIDDFPVFPSKKTIVIIGAILGGLFGCLSTFAREKMTGKVYIVNAFTKQLPCPLLQEVPSSDNSRWKRPLSIISAQMSRNTSTSSAGLLPVGDVDPEDIKEIDNQLRNGLGKKDLTVSSDPLSLKDCSSILLVVEPGKITSSELKALSSQLIIQNTPLMGFIVLDPYTKA